MTEAGRGELDDGLMIELIKRGALCGALERLSRDEPDAAAGLRKCAAFHRERCSALLGEMIGGQGSWGGISPLPHVPGRRGLSSGA